MSFFWAAVFALFLWVLRVRLLRRSAGRRPISFGGNDGWQDNDY